MNVEHVTTRDNCIDAFRGIAMLLVIFGHTITGMTIGSEQTFIYKIIWTLQMPMFFLISGYVTKYRKQITNIKYLFSFLKKITISYLWIWIIWTFLIRGMLFGNKLLLNPLYIIWHMDTGYWFLFSLWNINLIYGLAIYFSNKLSNHKDKYQCIYVALLYAVLMIFLSLFGYCFSLSFLGIKLTLYYMLFYLIGYLAGKYDSNFNKSYSNLDLKEIIVAISFVLWIVIISKFDLYSISDDINGVGLRFIASLSGCIAVFGLVEKILKDSKTINLILIWIGKYSLEIYLIHYLILNLFKNPIKYELITIKGFAATSVNFLVTILLSYFIINILNQNKYIKLWIFGRR